MNADLIVDAGHVKFGLKYHENDAGYAKHQREVRQSFTLGEQLTITRTS